METNEQEITIDYEYPAKHHFLRDLRLSLQFKGRGRCSIQAPVVPEICGGDGAMQAGIIATMVDILGGALSVRAIYPDWLATASLSIHLLGKATSGIVVATGSVLRAGKTTIVVEVDIHQEAGSQTRRIGFATMTFSRLPRKAYNIEVELDEDSTEVIDFALDTSGLTRPFLDEIGLKVLDESASVIELPLTDYVRNSFRVLQGGMFTLLCDVAGQYAARSATGKMMRTADMEVHYLEQGKVGPFQTRASVLRITEDSVLSRVELVDCGANETLLATATNLSIASL